MIPSLLHSNPSQHWNQTKVQNVCSVGTRIFQNAALKKLDRGETPRSANGPKCNKCQNHEFVNASGLNAVFFVFYLVQKSWISMKSIMLIKAAEILPFTLFLVSQTHFKAWFLGEAGKAWKPSWPLIGTHREFQQVWLQKRHHFCEYKVARTVQKHCPFALAHAH